MVVLFKISLLEGPVDRPRLTISQKVGKDVFRSFRRKPESIYLSMFWTPAFAGVTIQETFCGTVMIQQLDNTKRINPVKRILAQDGMGGEDFS